MWRLLSRLMTELWAVVKQTVQAWSEDNVLRMAASLSFYTTFSIAPALLIGLGVAGAIIGEAAAKSELNAKIQEFLSPDVAAYVASVLHTFWEELKSRNLPIVGVGAGIVAATAVFAELQSSLNAIWGVKSEGIRGVLRLLLQRVVSFVLVVGIGILLLVSVTTSAVLSAIQAFFADLFPVPNFLIHGLNLLASFAMIPLLLALAYKLIPDVPVGWREACIGSAVASLLFLAGKYLFGMYLRLSMLLSVYGAAGSLVILLVWVYYSSQVFFLGAEITKVCSRRFGLHSSADARDKRDPID